MEIPISVDDLWKLLPAIAPVVVEILKKLKETVVPQINLPWPMGIAVKAFLSALIGAIIAWLTSLDPMSGVAVGSSASIGYAIARPKAPKV